MVIALFIGMLVNPVRSESKTVLKIATLAPEGSSWMKALNKVDRLVKKQTEGRVEFRFYPGGVMGDEGIVIKKMKLGQIDGSFLSSGGMAVIFPDIHVTEFPLLVRTYEEADRLMDDLSPHFEKGMEDAGFSVLGWTEVGFVYLMSTQPMVRIEDLKGKKVWLWSDSEIPEALFKHFKLSFVALKVPDVLLGLQSGLVEVVYNSPLGALALQWFTKIQYITKLELAYSLGGLIVRQNKFDGIDDKDRSIIKKVVAECMVELKEKTRKDNEEALRIMQSEGVKIVEPAPEELDRFRNESKRIMESLGQKVLSRVVLTKALEIMAQ